MPVQKRDFCFVADEEAITPASATQSDKLFFFLKILVTGVVVLVAGVSAYFHWQQSPEGESPITYSDPVVSRQPSSQPSWKTVQVNNLLFCLGTDSACHPSKLNIALQVDNASVEEELNQSMELVKKHLILILSKKQELVFTDPRHKKSLEKEIIRELNAFLSKGVIKTVQWEQNFLQ